MQDDGPRTRQAAGRGGLQPGRHAPEPRGRRSGPLLTPAAGMAAGAAPPAGAHRPARHAARSTARVARLLRSSLAGHGTSIPPRKADTPPMPAGDDVLGVLALGPRARKDCNHPDAGRGLQPCSLAACALPCRPRLHGHHPCCPGHRPRERYVGFPVPAPKSDHGSRARCLALLAFLAFLLPACRRRCHASAGRRLT